MNTTANASYRKMSKWWIGAFFSPLIALVFFGGFWIASERAALHRLRHRAEGLGPEASWIVPVSSNTSFADWNRSNGKMTWDEIGRMLRWGTSLDATYTKDILVMPKSLESKEDWLHHAAVESYLQEMAPVRKAILDKVATISNDATSTDNASYFHATEKGHQLSVPTFLGLSFANHYQQGETTEALADLRALFPFTRDWISKNGIYYNGTIEMQREFNLPYTCVLLSLPSCRWTVDELRELHKLVTDDQPLQIDVQQFPNWMEQATLHSATQFGLPTLISHWLAGWSPLPSESEGILWDVQQISRTCDLPLSQQLQIVDQLRVEYQTDHLQINPVGVRDSARTLAALMSKAIIQNGISTDYSNFCGIAICVQLHRQEHGTFPETLDSVETLKNSKTPLEQIAGRPFVYRVTGDTVELATNDSLGPNKLITMTISLNQTGVLYYPVPMQIQLRPE